MINVASTEKIFLKGQMEVVAALELTASQDSGGTMLTWRGNPEGVNRPFAEKLVNRFIKTLQGWATEFEWVIGPEKLDPTIPP